MNSLSWKMISADGKNFEIAGTNFLANYHVSDPTGRYARFEMEDANITFKRIRKFFPAEAIICQNGESIGRIRSKLWNSEIILQNGVRYFTKLSLFTQRLTLKDSTGKTLLKRTNPKMIDRGVGKLQVDDTVSVENLSIILPSLFYSPAIFQSTLYLLLMASAALNVINFVRFFF